MFRINNNKGFSLIELMIVVAIIGILASVAIPNFQKFIRRSKQSEAKSNLSTVYQAQRSFHGEWQFYDGRYGHIGFSPEGDLTYEYATGAGPATPIYTARKGAAVSATNGAANNALLSTAFCGASGTCTPKPSANVSATAASSTAVAFVATAGADLQGDADDNWSMNEQKILTQTLNGE